MEETEDRGSRRNPALFAITEDNGWLVIWAEAADYVTRSRAELASAGGEAIGWYFWDDECQSGVSGYANGQLRWSVEHDQPKTGAYDYIVEGEPPPPFAEIAARLQKAQAEEDDDASTNHVCEVAFELAEALTGFGRDFPVGGGVIDIESWTRLQPVGEPKAPETSAKPGLLQRLFGAKGR